MPAEDARLAWLSLAASIAILIWLYLRGGTRNILACVAAVFVFMAFGPVVNLLMGASAYSGIVLTEIPEATTGFVLALAGLAAGDLVARQRTTFDPAPLARSTRSYELVPLVLAGLAMYAAVILVTKGAALVGTGKLDRIELAGGPRHRGYLLLEMYALSMYFIARRTPLVLRIYWVNAALYLGYCLATAERDFVFVLFSLLLHILLMRNRRASGWVIAGGVACVIGASALAAAREAERVSLEQTLNQGSIAFVDTFIMNEVPAHLPYRTGQTYVDTALSVLPDSVYTPGSVPLNEMLVDLHAPGSSGGYGFSLTAEAYLNFGMIGIPVVFFLLALGHRFVVNRCDRTDWWAYLSVLSVAALMYGLRGDSLQLVKSLLYGAVFFAVCAVCSLTRAGYHLHPATSRGVPPPVTPGAGRGGSR